ncbi:transcription antitermination factor NusB [Anaeropeptidivorans aminofermentans]|jgi:N utilization substance protein B|uniref:transcription antitermination factor NusB n=1 Tax=Anaeropeptidivorans aminofermentans TaxID=2934315 RepID=UPI002024691E|nr:transcription antitermination factor NusB [Anaeropeptidivorans aminofermentans]
MSRRTARKHAFSLVYQLEFYTDIEPDKILNEYGKDHELTDGDRAFIYQEISGVIQNINKIDIYITENLKGWKMDRLNTVDIAILRLAIYEILFAEDIPYSVSVNEAVELAKIYSSEEAPSFINGVLGSVVKSVGEV